MSTLMNTDPRALAAVAEQVQQAFGKAASLRPHLYCVDGFNVSVQASRHHYCHPRQDNAARYETVEVGFPSQRCEELMPYAERPECPTGSVYANVPVSVVAAVLLRHGGIDVETTMAGGNLRKQLD